MPLKHLHSFMMYSSREFPPLEEQAATLASLGYTNVETFPDLYADLAATKAVFDRFGLSVESAHVDLEVLEGDIERAVLTGKALGASIIVAPWLEPADRPVDTAGWKNLGRRLAIIADTLAKHGLVLAWHNHDFEFAALPDGTMPIEHVLSAENVFLELDAAWVFRAGADPLAWVEKLSDRIVIGHVKDVAAQGTKLDEDGWADVGEGEVPWTALWPAFARSPAKLMIVEHDQPSDYRRFARTSADAVRALSKGGKA